MQRTICRAVAVVILDLFLMAAMFWPNAVSPEKGPPRDAIAANLGKPPVFTLAWSEYPSWSVFGVADDLGLIDGRKGHQGTLEKKWGVDIVLHLEEYDTCITRYANGNCDALCVTNIDILAMLKSVAILPTSTSVGADACLVAFDVADKKKALVELKKHKVFGLSKSVSEYVFDRNLEKLGLKPSDYKFTDEPSHVAFSSMAAKKESHQAIMVWNPFVLELLAKNKQVKRLFDSSTIPEEIIDLVVVSDFSLKKGKGKEFACCIAEAFYETNKKIFSTDQQEADKVLSKLGERFSKLSLDDMKTCVKEAPFYKTPTEGLKLFTGQKLPETMKIVAKYCLDKEMIKTEAKFAFGEDKAREGVHLHFDPSYMRIVQATKK